MVVCMYYVGMNVCIMYVCMNVCMYVYLHTYVHIMYVCLCMYYVCIYVYLFIYLFIYERIVSDSVGLIVYFLPPNTTATTFLLHSIRDAYCSGTASSFTSDRTPTVPIQMFCRRSRFSIKNYIRTQLLPSTHFAIHCHPNIGCYKYS